MKKVLLLGGLGLAGFGLYRYFKYQVELALNYDYKIKNFKILSYDNDKINASIEIEVVNKSNFQILVNEYDLKISYKGKNFANAKKTTPFLVLPNTSFNLKTEGVINIKESKITILPFIQDVLGKKPINFEVSGFIKVKFIGINYTLNFTNDTFQYSSDLLRDLGLSKKVGSFKQKNPQIAKFLGIK
jgi:LEA14-like dessication related protein